MFELPQRYLCVIANARWVLSDPRRHLSTFEKCYIDAALAAGTVKHIVHSTGSTADVPEVIPRCSEFIFEREAYTRNSGINYTILRPCMFMQNIANMHADAICENGVWSETIDVDVSSGDNWLFEVLRENYRGFSMGAEGRNLLSGNVESITGVQAIPFSQFVDDQLDSWEV